MNLTNWPPKGLSWEVSFAPAIAVSRYENGGLDRHVAKGYFADSLAQKSIFSYSQITKSSNSCEGLAFEGPKTIFFVSERLSWLLLGSLRFPSFPALS